MIEKWYYSVEKLTPDYLERMLPDQLFGCDLKNLLPLKDWKRHCLPFSENPFLRKAKKKKMTAPKMIKLDNLERMSRGNTDYMAELLDLALELLPERMDSLTQSIESEDWIQYHQAAHSMKSIAKMVGIPVYDLLDKMDKGGRTQVVPGELIHMYETLKPQMEMAHQEMQQIRDGLN